MPFKIVHIHTDLKFIDESAIFEGSDFENEIIILGNKGGYNGRYQESAIYVNPSRLNIKQLINHCSDTDMVVLYNLCFIKSFIANRLTLRVKIAWRFFGHELYRYYLAEQYSELTKLMLTADKLRPSVLLKRLKNYFPRLQGLRKLIDFRAVYDYEFKRAVKRVDFFLWHFQEEYELLSKSWHGLPPFINLPTFCLPTINIDSGSSQRREKENLIIIGNCKNALNNHFDIIELLSSSKMFNKYSFYVPFNYDTETSYSLKLRKRVSLYDNIKFIETFLPLNEYELIFQKASALVVNTYRQKALGNIFLALNNGVKVYLNKQNICYSILKNRGFRVYLVDQLYDDLESQNICMRYDENNQNKLIARKQTEIMPIACFQQGIKALLRN